MTPLLQENTATTAAVIVAGMSTPTSPKCLQQPSSPSSSNSGTIARLFRPWRLANDGEGKKEDEKMSEIPESSAESPRRRCKKDRDGRKLKKRVGDGDRRSENTLTTTTSRVPTGELANDRVRPEEREGAVTHPQPSTRSTSSLHPPTIQAPLDYGRLPPLPQDPHLMANLNPFFHSQLPPSSHLTLVPPHLDPLLLAEMSDAEFERLGLLGVYGSGDFGAGGGNSRGLVHPSGSAKKQRPKKYRCPHCQVAFSNNGQLRGHVRIHTGERPFSCDYEGCGKAFTRNEELTRHRRIHSGQRPFACPLCEKRFGRKDHLKKHARTHAPPAPASHHAYALLTHGADPRFLTPSSAVGGPYTPSHHGLLIGGDPLSSPHSQQQRIVEMAMQAGFPYLYGY